MTASTDPPIWQEPVAPPVADFSFLKLPGPQRLKAWLELPEAKPALARLVGMLFTDVDDGTVTFTLEPSAWLAGPKGFVHPGFLAWLADSPFAMAVESALPPGAVSTTAELSLTYLGRVRVADGTLTGRGRFLGARGPDYLSEVAVTDAAGRLVAHGTSRCARIDLPLPDEAPPVTYPPYEGVEPWQRPVAGEVLTEEMINERSGLALLRAQVEGELPLPPVHHLTGIAPTAADEGMAEFSLPTGPWVQTYTNTVYGGALTLLASSAVSGAAQTLAPSAAACDSLDVKVNFLRPTVPDGRPLTARGSVQHAGRAIVVSGAEVTDADGRVVALATGSTRLG